MINFVEFLNEICSINSVSSAESGLAAFMERRMGEFSRVRVDPMGNVIAHRSSCASPGFKVMVEAHMDQIGLMVSSVTDHGFLHFKQVGGVDMRMLLGCEVVVESSSCAYPGVIARVDSGAEKGDAGESLVIDIGYKNSRELILPGDIVYFKPHVTELANGHVCSMALDDRIGLYVLLAVMERLENSILPFELYVVATTQEEIGLKGANTAAYSINPDVSLTIDVCHGTTPDASFNTFPLGTGAVISLGPNIHKEVSDGLIEVAKRDAVPYKVDVDGGSTGTNAWAIQVVSDDVRCGVISVPLRYMHTPCEVCKIDDVMAVVRLLSAYLRELSIKK